LAAGRSAANHPAPGFVLASLTDWWHKEKLSRLRGTEIRRESIDSAAKSG
jgi:hypothetical protein